MPGDKKGSHDQAGGQDSGSHLGVKSGEQWCPLHLKEGPAPALVVLVLQAQDLEEVSPQGGLQQGEQAQGEEEQGGQQEGGGRQHIGHVAPARGEPHLDRASEILEGRPL